MRCKEVAKTACKIFINSEILEHRIQLAADLATFYRFAVAGMQSDRDSSAPN
jgi:hypothetical protein